MNRPLRVALALGLVAGYALWIAGAASAAGRSCTQNPPGVKIDNNWGWGKSGSWGLAGQQLTYAISVRNYDVDCSSSSFTVSLSAPSGFGVSIPSDTIALKSYSSGYVWAYVTSPAGIVDGDYPLVVAVQRVGASEPSASYTSYYKVYSSDTAPPTLYWANPGDGTTISGRSYNVVVSSSDDHAVKKIDLYIDDVYHSTTACDDISYTCQLAYKWSLRGVGGQHTATFKSYDWLGNPAALKVTFTVN